MSSLANDLLNDFEDSGSENGDLADQENGDPTDFRSNDGETESADEDGGARDNRDGGDDMDYEEDAKIKVEKMKLGGVSDVRSVAGLMKTLQPVLEVSYVQALLYLSKDFDLQLRRSSPDSSSSIPENQSFSNHPSREANKKRFDRRRPRIQTPHPVKLAFYTDR
jgi:hypothetical protein